MVLIMYKYHLNDVEWGEFKVGGNKGVFKVSNSKPYHKANLTISSKGIPYVTRTSMNNGLEDLIVDANYEKNPKNTISLGAENADFFFQGIDYVSGNKMYSIGNNKITREVGLFLVQVFRQSIKECGFGYGKGLTGTRFKNRYVMLPIDEKNNPNWHFMEEYIKEREDKQRNNLREYCKNRLLDMVICPEVLKDVEWGEFFVSDIFDVVQRGKRLTKARQMDGETPYISSTSLNNGVDNFIGNIEDVRKTAQTMGLVLNEVQEANDKVNENLVISQDIAAGKMVKSGDKITLKVSTGYEKTRVPTVVGMDEGTAKATLANANLKTNITYENDETHENGKVISQSVEQNKEVKVGTTIELKINKIEKKEKTVTLKFKVPGTATPSTNTTNTTTSANKVAVQIIVNNRIVADYSKDKGENVEFELKGTGSQDVKIKINGTTRLTRTFNIEDVSESVIID